MGSQLSRLERTPDKREVGGSSPLEPMFLGSYAGENVETSMESADGIHFRRGEMRVSSESEE